MRTAVDFQTTIAIDQEGYFGVPKPSAVWSSSAGCKEGEEGEMTGSNPPSGWPKVEFKDAAGTTRTAGWIPPLNKKLLPKGHTTKSRIFGVHVSLHWHFDDVSELLVDSEQDAETLIHVAGGKPRQPLSGS